MNTGDTITVRQLHADGVCYCWWQATVESVSDDCVVVLNQPGQIGRHAKKGTLIAQTATRAFFWLDKPYNLLEEYNADGELEQIYMNVASPPEIDSNTLTFTDHELDISCIPGQSSHILDQDDFEEAARRYGYSPQFQARCRQIAQEALALAERWQTQGVNPHNNSLSKS